MAHVSKGLPAPHLLTGGGLVTRLVTTYYRSVAWQRESQLVYGLAEGSVYGLVSSPLAAADEGPTDGQNSNSRQEASQDDVEHPPF